MGALLIVLRRSLAILLSLLFLILFVVTILVTRVNGTLLEPKFYTDTLVRLDFYNFLYEEALPAAIEESGVNLQEDVPLGLDLTPRSVSAYAARVLPPSWLQAQVEGAITTTLPYMLGETESFQATIEMSERVEAGVEVFKEVAVDAKVYDYLLDDVVAPEIERNRESLLGSLPLGVSLTTAEILDGVKEVVPEDWLKQEVISALDEVTPYIVGRSDTFRVVVPLEERATVGLVVLERWLQKSLEGGAYDYLLREQIAPLITSNLSGGAQLPLGVTISDQEIVDAMGKVLPPEWVSARVSDTFDAVGPYLTGKTETFVIDIPIQDRMELAAEVLVDLADAQLKAIFDALPACTTQQLLNLQLTLDSIPECLPSGLSYETVKGLMGVDVLDQIAAQLVTQVPSSIQITDKELFSSVGQDLPIETVREVLRDGFVFTEGDLRTLIADQGSPDTLATFDEMRGYLKDGFTFTSDDLREQLGPDQAQFDEIREQVSTGRSLLWLTFVVLLVVLAGVGFLGGRSWWGRLGWAGVPLLIAGLIVAVAIGLGLGQLRTLSDEAIRSLEAPQVFITKLFEVRAELIRSFVNPLRLQAILAAIVGIAMIVAGFLGPRLMRRT